MDQERNTRSRLPSDPGDLGVAGVSSLRREETRDHGLPSDPGALGAPGVFLVSGLFDDVIVNAIH
jgi:hypothetical protein